MIQPMVYRSTVDDYSPWDQLPQPEPRYTQYYTRHFYENTAKHLIKDTVRIMMNGLGIDLQKVAQLEEVLDNQLNNVEDRLAANKYIKQFLQQEHSKQLSAYIADRKAKLKPSEDFIKPFNPKDMVHRSYFMHIYATQQGISLPTEEVAPGISKWPVKLVQKLATTRPVLRRLLEGKLSDHPIAKQAIQQIAEYKAELRNKSYYDQIANPQLDVPAFSPRSPQQKQRLFEMLGIPSEDTTDKGAPKWDRDQIERVNKETVDPDVQDLTQALIDHSFAAIVRSNFIEAFYNYTTNGRLYGTYRLLGAKSGRFTSNSPNMLNTPSTGTIFAKPIKECFVPREGFLIASIDYSALEDRVVASLSGDTNKCALFLEGLDGHCLSATYYYPDRVKEILGDFTDNKQAAIDLKYIVDNEHHPMHKLAKSVRQDSKPVSFGLAYGAFPPKVAATIKVPLDVAEGIFNAYHYELFPGISDYRENYVLPTAIEQGQLHLGLGFNLLTDDPDKDIRTLSNATIQFWSILSALTINKMHQLIDKAGYENDIYITSTIYDSIYAEVRKDPEIIKWYNDNIVGIMETDFMVKQTVHNEARLEIGTDWANLTELNKNASVKEIQEVIASYNL